MFFPYFLAAFPFYEPDNRQEEFKALSVFVFPASDQLHYILKKEGGSVREVKE
ncbi:hypothetical protein EXN66_Car019282 [Channa argus]|uniref:Uncharacterized protein n=1 Tax=Channa argus TaxID=215402 RepID=A0A6G1QM92_CHAAH|nr:hypothetical protein EXN66_Car019282 [Channa argus]